MDFAGILAAHENFIGWVLSFRYVATAGAGVFDWFSGLLTE